MATITLRALSTDGTNTPRFGNGLGNLVSDIDAVALLLQERLWFWQGTWWENVLDGVAIIQPSSDTASSQFILGSDAGQEAWTLILQNWILATPYVTGLTSVSDSYSASTRGFAFSCTVQTQFGPISVSLSGGNGAAIVIVTT